nr:mucin-2-like [Labrus bergylta]
MSIAEQVTTSGSKTDHSTEPTFSGPSSIPTQTTMSISITIQTQSKPPLTTLTSTKTSPSVETALQTIFGKTPVETQPTSKTSLFTGQTATNVGISSNAMPKDSTPFSRESTTLQKQDIESSTVPLEKYLVSMTTSSPTMLNQPSESATLSSITSTEHMTTAPLQTVSSVKEEAPNKTSTNTHVSPTYFPRLTKTEETMSEATTLMSTTNKQDEDFSLALHSTTTPLQTTSTQTNLFVPTLPQTTIDETSENRSAHVTNVSSHVQMTESVITQSSSTMVPPTTTKQSAGFTTVHSITPSLSGSESTSTQTTPSTATVLRTQDVSETKPAQSFPPTMESAATSTKKGTSALARPSSSSSSSSSSATEHLTTAKQESTASYSSTPTQSKSIVTPTLTSPNTNIVFTPNSVSTMVSIQSFPPMINSATTSTQSMLSAPTKQQTSDGQTAVRGTTVIENTQLTSQTQSIARVTDSPTLKSASFLTTLPTATNAQTARVKSLTPTNSGLDSKPTVNNLTTEIKGSLESSATAAPTELFSPTKKPGIGSTQTITAAATIPETTPSDTPSVSKTIHTTPIQSTTFKEEKNVPIHATEFVSTTAKLTTTSKGTKFTAQKPTTAYSLMKDTPTNMSTPVPPGSSPSSRLVSPTTSPYSLTSIFKPAKGMTDNVTDTSSLQPLPLFSEDASTTNPTKAKTAQHQFDHTSGPLLGEKTFFPNTTQKWLL